MKILESISSVVQTIVIWESTIVYQNKKKTRNVEPSVVHQTFLNIDNFPSGCDLDLSYLNQHLFQEPFPNIFQGVLCISNIGSFKFHVRTHFMKMIELAC